MDEISIYTYIHSRYRAFDTSGRFSFSIVFVFKTAGSVLDVPYALAHGLLTFHKENPRGAKRWTEMDTSGLNVGKSEATDYIILPSPVGRLKSWRDALTAYQCRIDYADGLATTTLVRGNTSGGNADFTVGQDLPWPPEVKVGLRISVAFQIPDGSHTSDEMENRQVMEVSVMKQGSDAITVQTRGHQRYLIPWGPHQSEDEIDADRTRIIDPELQGPPLASLQVIDLATDALIRGHEQRNICTLTALGADLRPKVGHLVTLKPGVPLVKQYDMKAVVKALADGQYRICLQPKGCSWWAAKMEDVVGEDGRVLKKLCGDRKVPLMIQSKDRFELRLKDGSIDLPI
ncbi:MAG: hypothetical protein Q9183_004707 [Haloplaca sp. 2 TL-2023]